MFAGYCACLPSWTGADCSQHACRNFDCHNVDSCNANSATSSNNPAFLQLAHSTAEGQCYGHGVCQDGACVCNPHSGVSAFTQCRRGGCPGVGSAKCSGHGTCDNANAALGACVCDANHMGVDCALDVCAPSLAYIAGSYPLLRLIV